MTRHPRRAPPPGTARALLVPQGFGILGAVFPRDQIGRAFSAFGPVLGLSAVGGPILAAALIDTDPFGLGWRSMFLINIVLGGAALLAAHRLLPRPRASPPSTSTSPTRRPSPPP
ncbi:Major Facilitator Superfamily protein [Streptomyces yunnanensis]|uniref:Major Facilitator Superfamily protein n=1 Tax=Streptomyces yunnanensis TaxID=156453 RepID=A0A9X8MPW9_9ACTN|nr:Major Facilitator Superfamily protein [Streptomyces yunnanensis]